MIAVKRKKSRRYQLAPPSLPLPRVPPRCVIKTPTSDALSFNRCSSPSKRFACLVFLFLCSPPSSLLFSSSFHHLPSFATKASPPLFFGTHSQALFLDPPFLVTIVNYDKPFFFSSTQLAVLICSSVNMRASSVAVVSAACLSVGIAAADDGAPRQ